MADENEVLEGLLLFALEGVGKKPSSKVKETRKQVLLCLRAALKELGYSEKDFNEVVKEFRDAGRSLEDTAAFEWLVRSIIGNAAAEIAKKRADEAFDAEFELLFD